MHLTGYNTASYYELVRLTATHVRYHSTLYSTTQSHSNKRHNQCINYFWQFHTRMNAV